ncbi:TetR/AcrR family transcriptional regulator [Sphingobium limneticum]|jgi:AcrR family transcriptional regulator|uniref:TetR/AcrR family transcriptional regulator n=1 Tax=Sphingobium limneticum TaxID=1007511 RepID=UPI003D047F1B
MTKKCQTSRRAEIGAEKRGRTRAQLIVAARELYGRDGGRASRIEEICALASTARGTFYNYFPSIDAIQVALFVELSRDFDDAVHVVFEQFPTASARTSAAIRYYLGRAIFDPAWGWGMVNTGMGTGLPMNQVTQRVDETIKDGIDSGEFLIDSPRAGRDILLGSGLAAMITILQGGLDQSYADRMAQYILMALGVDPAAAATLIRADLPELEWHSSVRTHRHD